MRLGCHECSFYRKLGRWRPCQASNQLTLHFLYTQPGRWGQAKKTQYFGSKKTQYFRYKYFMYVYMWPPSVCVCEWKSSKIHWIKTTCNSSCVCDKIVNWRESWCAKKITKSKAKVTSNDVVQLGQCHSYLNETFELKGNNFQISWRHYDVMFLCFKTKSSHMHFRTF